MSLTTPHHGGEGMAAAKGGQPRSEALGHVVPTLRKQTAMNASAHLSSPFIQPRPSVRGMVMLTFRAGFPNSVNAF